MEASDELVILGGGIGDGVSQRFHSRHVHSVARSEYEMRTYVAIGAVSLFLPSCSGSTYPATRLCSIGAHHAKPTRGVEDVRHLQ